MKFSEPVSDPRSEAYGAFLNAVMVAGATGASVPVSTHTPYLRRCTTTLPLHVQDVVGAAVCIHADHRRLVGHQRQAVVGTTVRLVGEVFGRAAVLDRLCHLHPCDGQGLEELEDPGLKVANT